MKRCGSCYYFTPAGPKYPQGHPYEGKQPGECQVNPPVLSSVPQEVPGSALGPHGRQMKMVPAGMSPPTYEDRKDCRFWKSKGEAMH